jgi:MFS family permease
MKRMETSYYAFSFLFQFLIWVPVFYEIQLMAGLSPSEIFRIQSWYYLTYFIVEIPTGLLADRIGSRACLVIGGMVLTAANAILLTSMGYSIFLWHFVAVGLARSLISGAGSAWAYTMLAETGQTSRFRVMEGRARSAGLIGRLLSWPFAPMLMSHSLGLPYLISTATALLSVIAAFSMPLPQTSQVKPMRRALGDDLLNIAKSLTSNPKIIPAIMQGVGIFVLMRIVLINLYNPLVTGSGISVAWLGTIMACITAIEALTSAQQDRLLSNSKNPPQFAMFMTIAMSLSVICMAVMNPWICILSLAVFAGLGGLIGPVQKQYINDVIDRPELRASILSVESLVDRLVCAGVVILLGQLVDTGRFQEALIYTAIAVIMIQILSYVPLRRRIA